MCIRDSNTRTVPLTDDLFDYDSHCMLNLRSKTLAIVEKDTGRAVRCNIEGYPYAVSYTHLDVYKRQDVFHAQLLTPQDAPAMDQLCAACGTPGGPDTAALLQTNAVLGDYAGTDTLSLIHIS